MKAVETNAYYLADLAVEETGFGKLEDKAFKIMQPLLCCMMK